MSAKIVASSQSSGFGELTKSVVRLCAGECDRLHVVPDARISAAGLQLFPELVPGLQAPIELMDREISRHGITNNTKPP